MMMYFIIIDDQFRRYKIIKIYFFIYFEAIQIGIIQNVG